jgi:hypothetical protein
MSLQIDNAGNAYVVLGGEPKVGLPQWCSLWSSANVVRQKLSVQAGFRGLSRKLIEETCHANFFRDARLVVHPDCSSRFHRLKRDEL